MDLILKFGLPVETRGLHTLEISPVIFKVNGPRSRITTLKERNWRFSSALGELAWHLSGSNDLYHLRHYIKKWDDYSDDARTISSSCYGYKLFKIDNTGRNAWSNIVNILKNDSQSRRAVFSFFDNDAVNLTAKDVSCTCSIQFLIRNGVLDIIVYMRSNDLYYGLPYDFFVFSFLQEAMAAELNVELGQYIHFAASLHLYLDKLDIVRKILESVHPEPVMMPAIKNYKELTRFLEVEAKIRTGNLSHLEFLNLEFDNYWKDLLTVLYYDYLKKRKSNLDIFDFQGLPNYYKLLN